jgi:pimeloyl-ACP methyl ester carboxylesterase
LAPHQVRQPKVGGPLLSSVLAALFLVPLIASGWAITLTSAFLVEFLSDGRVRALSTLTPPPRVEPLAIPGLEADRYTMPASSASLVLAHGLAPEGKDDLRLQRAAALLARAGFVVAVPTIRGLTALRLRPSDVETVVTVIAAMPPPVAVVGVSVGAGPALLAAADPRVRDRVTAVLSLGGYAAADELARFYIRGEPELTRLFAEANPELMDASARRALTTGSLDDLSPDLRHLLESLSPERVVEQIRGRLLIVHGRDDRLVPVSESLRLARAAHALEPRVAIVSAVGHVSGVAGNHLLDLARLWGITYVLITGR